VSVAHCLHGQLPTYNAALNKPAYVSSPYDDSVYGVNFNASLANDGNRETNATKDNKPSCAVSGRETHPWWAVDLGSPTTVYRVDLTNRGDCQRMCVVLVIVCRVSQGFHKYCLQ